MYLSSIINSKKTTTNPPVSRDLGSVTGKKVIDLSMPSTAADAYKATITGNTNFEFVFGIRDKYFLLVLENAGDFTVTFPNYIKWNQGVVPNFTSGGIDHIYFSKMGNFGSSTQPYVSGSVLSNMTTV